MKFVRYQPSDRHPEDVVDEIYVGVIEKNDLIQVTADPRQFFERAAVGAINHFQLQTVTADSVLGEEWGEVLTIVVKYRAGVVTPPAPVTIHGFEKIEVETVSPIVIRRPD